MKLRTIADVLKAWDNLTNKGIRDPGDGFTAVDHNAFFLLQLAMSALANEVVEIHKELMQRNGP